MMKIGKQEYEMLKRLEGDWMWIARDSDRSLFTYSEKPYKYYNQVWSTDDDRAFLVDNHLLQFIQWEDRDPYSIAELIREYESEETEVKRNIEWLKGRFAGRKIFSPSNDREIGYNKAIDEFSKYVDQLEEKEKPAIPQFVADYIEKCKGWNDDEEFYDEDNAIDLFGAMDLDNAGMSDKVHDYLVDNQEAFARAWLDGYTAEEEELLYRARLKVITDEFIASYLRTQSSGAEDRLKALEIGSKYIHEDYRHLSEFTEDELKRLDIWGSDQWEIEEVEENE